MVRVGGGDDVIDAEFKAKDKFPSLVCTSKQRGLFIGKKSSDKNSRTL